MGINSLIEDAVGLAKQNPVATAGGIGVVALGSGLAISAFSRKKTKKRSKRTSRKKRIKHTKRGLRQDRKRRSKQKWEVAYQKRKRRGKVKYTKNGQPYIILKSGKARFIKGKRRGK